MADNGEEPKKPAGWTKGYSTSQKRHYYSHSETKHTQWHFPTASEVADPGKARKRAEQNVREEKERMRQQHQKAKAKEKARPAAQKRSASHSSSAGTGGDSLGLGDMDFTVKVVAPRGGEKKRPKLGSALDPNRSNADSTSVAVIVPYRDLHESQNRSRHLDQFVPWMRNFLQRQVDQGTMSDFRIYIVEQSDDGRKFNRGKLLNIGFDLARNEEGRVAPDVFIFHDVDLLPADDLGPWYSKFPRTPIHIARVWDRYSNNPKYFGGIVSFSSSDMKRINGYPNTFWGWGGEDDEMQKRCERLKIRWQHPPRGTITDLEDMSLTEKLSFLKSNREWKCMVKWEALDEHEKTWRTNGLADLRYKVLSTVALGEDEDDDVDLSLAKVKKITVDVQLNGNHWANDKCGLDFKGDWDKK